MTINPMNFIINLKYLGVGMLSIIIVIGVIIFFTVLLNKLTAEKKTSKANKSEKEK